MEFLKGIRKMTYQCIKCNKIITGDLHIMELVWHIMQVHNLIMKPTQVLNEFRKLEQ